MGLPMTEALCRGCPKSTTKVGPFETGILRCGACGCIVWVKSTMGMECPVFKTEKEAMDFRNGEESNAPKKGPEHKV